MTRDELIELLKQNAEPDDLIAFLIDGEETEAWLLKPSGVCRWSPDVVVVNIEYAE